MLIKKTLGLLLLLTGCGTGTPPPPAAVLPAILLVTLDTTRADHVAPEAPGDATPTLAGLAARGVTFAHAYTTAPMTLPAHTSMMTGLYPGGHGIHENGRRVPAGRELLAERLRALGYHTAAFISGAPLERAAGLARGFERYDDQLGGRPERNAADTTAQALAHLPALGEPAFLWVHYFDPHEPYAPPEPFASRFAADPYRGEIAFMDHELGRLVAAFEARYAARGTRLIVLGDHGEGRGDHGEAFHGHLLYQATMRVPLVIVDSPSAPRRLAQPVSTRAVFDSVLGWARGESSPGLLASAPDLVLGEAMKPYLDYGWQPQVMAVRGTRKAIQTGTVETELYDLLADPGETYDLAASTPLDREVRQALREYPVPSPGGATTDPARSADLRELERLASLGYLVSSGPPTLRPDAPVPRRMTALFPDLSQASGLFSGGRFAESIPVFERILRADPGNISAALRLAAAHSGLGHDGAALAAFERARKIDPDSIDVRHYLGLHLLRTGRLDAAVRELQAVLRVTPDRLPTLLAFADAAMGSGDTAGALGAFERARELDPESFDRDLELGVLQLAARRLSEARESLDRVPAHHPAYAMALFKRAQVAVLLGEPDADERIRQAREGADESTRELVAREALFRR